MTRWVDDQVIIQQRVRPHLHLLLVLADNEVVSPQGLQGLCLLLLTGAENSHLHHQNASLQSK